MGVFLPGRGRGNFFTDFAPELVAALYTTAKFGRIQGLVMSRFTAHPAAAWFILPVVGVIVAVDKGLEGAEESFLLHRCGSQL